MALPKTNMLSFLFVYFIFLFPKKKVSYIMDDVDFNQIQINYELYINRIHLIKVNETNKLIKWSCMTKIINYKVELGLAPHSELGLAYRDIAITNIN